MATHNGDQTTSIQSLFDWATQRSLDDPWRNMPYRNGINPALDASDFFISSMDSPSTELLVSSTQAGTCSPISVEGDTSREYYALDLPPYTYVSCTFSESLLHGTPQAMPMYSPFAFQVFWPDLISGFKLGSADSVTTTPFTYDNSALKDDHLIPHLPSIASTAHPQPPDFEPPTAGWRSDILIQELAAGDSTMQEWKMETCTSTAMDHSWLAPADLVDWYQWNETNVAYSHPPQSAPDPELTTLESASWDHDGGESIQHKRECSATTDSIPSWSRNCGRGESTAKPVQCLWNGCRHQLQLPKAGEIKNHLRSHHDISLSASSSTRITCQWDHNGYMCGRKMFHRSLVKHIAITHLKADVGTCPACSEKFGRRDSLKRHMIAQHPFKSCGA